MTLRCTATRSRHGGQRSRCASTDARVARRGLAVDVGREQRIELAALTHRASHHVRFLLCSPPDSTCLDSGAASVAPVASRSYSARRPREIRDITVPIGTSRTSGDFRVRQLLHVAQPDRLPERVRQRVERRLQVGVERRAGQQLLGRVLLAAATPAACSTISLSTSIGLRPSCRRMLRNVLWRIVNSHAFRFVPR